jgi:peptide/nickel transport system ATP-binding protein
MNDLNETSVVEVNNLSLAYRHGDGWLQVLDNVNFSIAKGEALGLVGESGCGKSTVAHSLLGYRTLNSKLLSGVVKIHGEDVLSMDRNRLDQLRGRHVSFVPQNPTMALSPHLRVGRQVAEILLLHRRAIGKEQAAARVNELFSLVSLPEPEALAKRYPHQLSGGQQQRVCIAMALACEPDLVVLDEPTTGLDVTTQKQIIQLLRNLRAKIGMSMLYVTHDLGLLGEIADRVGVMYAGHMVEIGPTEQIYQTPKHPYTRGLIASVPDFGPAGEGVDRPLRGILRREELPKGCPFSPRCDFAKSSCSAEPQNLSEVSKTHRVACMHWQEVAVSKPARDETTDMRTILKATAKSSDPILKVEGITLSYGKSSSLLDRWLSPKASSVVDDISFEILDGECFALVGESGSGKSTIARAISGLLKPDNGQILFEGRKIHPNIQDRRPDVRRKIQYIFQNPDDSLNPRAQVGRILSRPLKVFFKLGQTAEKNILDQALAEVQLDANYVKRYPDQLSGGERQRVAIARALIAEPTLLLCDEVLSALDVSVQANILALFRQLRGESNVAMLFISHDLAVVRLLADRVAVLFHGRICEIGLVGHVFAPPFHPYTRSILNAVPGNIQTGSQEPKMDLTAAPAHKDGCVYAGRCIWQRGEICEKETPPWRETDSTSRIRCHIPLDELSELANCQTLDQK